MAAYQAHSLSHRMFRRALRMFETTVSAVSRDTYMKIAVEIVEELDRVVRVETPEGELLFHCDSEVARIRAKGALVREPDTLDWIRGFEENETLLDIGSNVGVFSLFAAMARKTNVIACDPLPQNHHALARNVAINNVSHLVLPICIALNDVPEIAELTVPRVADAAGGAGATFGEDYDNYQNRIEAAHILKAPGISLDSLIETFGLPAPTHIKMDIDGIQDKVIQGAANTLRHDGLKSVMLELNPRDNPRNIETYDFIRREMDAAGFELDKIVRTSPNGSEDTAKSPTNQFFLRP